MEAAAFIRGQSRVVSEANNEDVSAARAYGLSGPMLDRLMLGDDGIEVIASGLEAMAALPDPLGRILADWTRPNGLSIQRVAVPIGVIGIIYESRPNVTADAGGLCIKSGNATILRGGSESFRSSTAIVACLRQGLEAAGLPAGCVQSIATTDRQAVGEMLRLSEFIDVIVPRGGKSLVARVAEESRIPVFAHLEGLCHVYLDAEADPEMARAVTVNAKLRRVSVCGAAETLLIDATAVDKFLPVLSDLATQGCEIRADAAIQARFPAAVPASEMDWTTEYLDRIIAVAAVDGVRGAIAHINRYGSHHTDSIVTDNQATAETFLNGVDSGIVLVNASTQFADGGEFGFGAEIGISTGRLHARGPIGAEQLTTYKYKVRGTGQIRP